jgi:integrase
MRASRTSTTINLLAASTGMRMGEIQALQVGNIFDNHVHVEYSWARKYGLKPLYLAGFLNKAGTVPGEEW